MCIRWDALFVVEGNVARVGERRTVGNHDHASTDRSTTILSSIPFSTFLALHSSKAMRPTRYMVPKTETCRAIESLRTKFSQVRFQIVCRWSPPFFGLASHTPTFLVLYLDSIRPTVMYFQNRYNRLDLFTDSFLFWLRIGGQAL